MKLSYVDPYTSELHASASAKLIMLTQFFPLIIVVDSVLVSLFVIFLWAQRCSSWIVMKQPVWIVYMQNGLFCKTYFCDQI